MRCLRLIAWLLVPSAALACKCESSFSVCHEFALSGSVFVGTVESVTPSFLDRFNSAQRPSLPLINEAEARYHDVPSPANLNALKETFRKSFPDLPADSMKKLDGAKSSGELSSLFDSVLDHGKKVRFQVHTVFRGDDDDDKSEKKDADEKKPQAFDVYTPFGDCGVDFQVGETYLVFADDDEETNILETTRCSRTNRLTDAGSDLAYLYFLENRKEASGRLEGFVTGNPFYQKEIDQNHDPEKISSPVAGAMIELLRAGRARYTSTDAGGHFVFDGLVTGDYQMTPFAAGYPDTVKQLQATSSVRVETKSCTNATILVQH